MRGLHELNPVERLRFDMFGFPMPPSFGKLSILFRRLNAARHPWDGLFTLGATLGLYATIVLAASLIIVWDGSPLSLVLGVPAIGLAAAVASHLVPPRVFETVE
jgi:hypothetical protein